MATYNFPDVYINKTTQSVSNVIASASGTIGAIIGRAQRGVRNKAILITSWAEYLETFAYGMESPFIADSYLAHAVYGFFQNGGSEIYVVNASDGKEAKAKATVSGLEFVALDAGAWGNKLKVAVVKDTDAEGSFDVNIYYGDTVSTDTLVESYSVTNDTVLSKINGISNFVSITSAEAITLAETEEAIALNTGSDGDALTSYEKKIYPLFDSIDDVSLIALADSGTDADNQALLDYCAKHDNLQAVLGPESEETDWKTVLNSTLSGRGVIAYPWGGIVNPITNEVVNVPPQGHTMGMIARMIENRGYQKVPAGTTATINGFVSLSVELDKTQAGKLNDKNVCCLLDKKNYGIVCWGGRSRIDDGRYINSLLLESKIARDLYNGLQPFVFEPNTSTTWKKVAGRITKYMSDLWKKGTFEGTTEAESFVVICDETVNTEKTIAAKQLNATVAYREKDCAEFIVVNLSRILQ